jgi:Papain family cysteine protease
MCLQDSFYNYESGVYNQENCCKDIVHAMIIVGYGVDPVGGDYW